MSDTSAKEGALDPKRPWITDESQLPSKMNWLSTYFNPAGTSSKLHFTRAWTVLFFTQFLLWFGVGIMILGIAGMAGADTSVARVAFTYLLAIVFVVTTVFSYVIHSRRLNHAGRSPLWALIVLIPMLVAVGGFYAGMMGKMSAYNDRYEARDAFLEDPQTWQEKHLEVRRERQAEEKERQEKETANKLARENPQQCLADAKAAEAAARKSGEDAGDENEAEETDDQGAEDEPKFDDKADKEMPSIEEFVLRPNASSIPMMIMLLSFPVMLWSLLWVARAPLNGAQYERKGLGNILFSRAGRIGRIQYVAGFLMACVLSTLVLVIVSILSMIVPPANIIGYAVLALFFVFMMVSITTKRLHDMGQSGFRMLLPWAATIFAGLIGAGVAALNGQAMELAQYNCGDMPMAVPIGFGTAIFIAAGAHLGFLLWMLLGWPEMRDNKYGPAPIPGEMGPQYPEGVETVRPQGEKDLFA